MRDVPVVVAFAKLPVPGQVKSRLAATIGNDKAALFYRLCAEHTFKEISSCKAGRGCLAYSPSHQADKFAAWLWQMDLTMDLVPQVDTPDLGQRMFHALDGILRGGAQKAIVVGTDIPDLSAAILAEALEALNTYEVVLGPACDSGFYLLGVTRLPETLLQGITWSTSTVLSATRQSAESHGLSLAPANTLPVLMDIDTIEDLQQWQQSCEAEGRVSHPLFVNIAEHV